MHADDDIEAVYPRPLSGSIVSTPPPALLPARQPLRGKYVELVPMNPAVHGADLYEASHGTGEALGIWDYLADGPWPTLEAYIAALRGQTAMHDRVYMAIRPLGDAKFSGQASFMDMDARNGVIEIGHIWFGLHLRRTRAATESLYLMIRHAMDDLGYRQMQWRCNAQNRGSRGAAKRLGFRFEGIFFNHLIYKGKNRDTAWYSILDVEWPELRGIFEEWLSAENFSADGVARQPLSDLMSGRSRHVNRGFEPNGSAG